MRRIVFAVWIILSSGFSPLFAQDKSPAIVFDNESRDYGKVMEGEKLEHVFKFTNKGESLLEIFGVEPG